MCGAANRHMNRLMRHPLTGCTPTCISHTHLRRGNTLYVWGPLHNASPHTPTLAKPFSMVNRMPWATSGFPWLAAGTRPRWRHSSRTPASCCSALSSSQWVCSIQSSTCGGGTGGGSWKHTALRAVHRQANKACCCRAVYSGHTPLRPPHTALRSCCSHCRHPHTQARATQPNPNRHSPRMPGGPPSGHSRTPGPRLASPGAAALRTGACQSSSLAAPQTRTSERWFLARGPTGQGPAGGRAQGLGKGVPARCPLLCTGRRSPAAQVVADRGWKGSRSGRPKTAGCCCRGCAASAAPSGSSWRPAAPCGLHALNGRPSAGTHTPSAPALCLPWGANCCKAGPCSGDRRGSPITGPFKRRRAGGGSGGEQAAARGGACTIETALE